MSKEPVQPQDKYVVRFPDGMRAALKEAAAKNNRSLNAEILHRLENWDQVIEQLDLAEEGWEAARKELASLDLKLNAALDEKHRMRQLGWDRANAGPSDAELEAKRVMQLALETLEASVADQRRTLLHDRYMLSQIRLMRGLLDRVAKSDGVVPGDLLAMIRILSAEGKGVDPTDEAVAQLVTQAIQAIESLEEGEIEE